MTIKSLNAEIIATVTRRVIQESHDLMDASVNDSRTAKQQYENAKSNHESNVEDNYAYPAIENKHHKIYEWDTEDRGETNAFSAQHKAKDGTIHHSHVVYDSEAASGYGGSKYIAAEVAKQNPHLPADLATSYARKIASYHKENYAY